MCECTHKLPMYLLNNLFTKVLGSQCGITRRSTSLEYVTYTLVELGHALGRAGRRHQDLYGGTPVHRSEFVLFGADT